jgi:hypothetical protein
MWSLHSGCSSKTTLCVSGNSVGYDVDSIFLAALCGEAILLHECCREKLYTDMELNVCAVADCRRAIS